MKTMQIAFE